MTRTSTHISRAALKPIALFLSVVSIMLFLGNSLYAQTPYAEGFNSPLVAGATWPQNNIPFGWSQGKISGVDLDNYFDRINNTGFPNVVPRSAPASLRYRSWSTTSGEASFIASKKLDMRAMPAGGTTFSFWMWRDNGSAATDNIEVYINSAPNMTGASLRTETVTLATVINRAATLAPVPVTVNGWNQYFYTIPQATWNTNSVYVIFKATSAFGNDIYIDDFTIDTWPNTQAYTAGSMMAVNQNASTTAKNATNQQIIGGIITMDGALTPLALSNMQFNTNGSTNPTTDIVNAKLWFSGGTPTFDTLSATLLGTVVNPWSTNYTFAGPWANILQHGDNYFWITYNINLTAVSGNFVDAEWIGANIGASPYTPNPGTLVGEREIDLVYCIPQYFVGTAWLNYQTNDYIKQVVMVGNPPGVPAPGINNNLNTIYAYAGTSCPGPFPTTCPFQSHPPDYELYPQVAGKTTSLTANGTTNYPISLTVGTYGSGNAIAAWIDFNKDGTFQATEKIAQSGPLGALGVYNTTFQVPITAIAGKTRMRVREVWINYNIDPCAAATYGETEDYVVTIVPDCPGATGYTTWLGFTDDWTDPSNWCPAVPPMVPFPLANVRIPGGPSSAGYTYIKPVIRSNVVARAIKLRLESDTIFIDAPSGSSLTVTDSVKITTNTSAILVNSSMTSSAILLNGNLTQPTVNNNNTPLNNSQRVRSFLVYTQAELTSQGLIAGDIITDIQITMERKSTTPTYNNFTMKYYYTNSGFVFVPGNPALVIPPVVGAPATPVTIRNTGVWSVASIPINTVGNINIPLTTPLPLAATGNNLVIELSYDNLAGTTGINDQIRFTQTTGFRRYLTLANFGPSTPSYPVASYLPATTVNTSAPTASFNLTVTSSANLAVGMNVAAGGGIPPGSLITGIINATTISINNATTSIVAAAPRIFGTNVFQFSSQLEYRPNLTFKYTRPYIKYEIAVGGHWDNNGTFGPGISRVTMNGTAQQQIMGTDSTTFYDLRINNAAHVLRMADIGVTDTLHLQSGKLKLNLGLVTLTNPTGLQVTAGAFQGETDVLAANVAPYGRFKWDMGSTPGPRSIPFMRVGSATNIPLSYNIISGTHYPIFSTYNTTVANTNIPAPISNINAYYGGTDNSANMVDRYYMIDNSASTAPVADLVFRYDNAERAGAPAIPVRGQRWLTATSAWEFPFLTQSYTSGNPDQVSITGFSAFSSNLWWAFVLEPSPLPVALLDFSAVPYKDKVKLKWTTASEINSSHFIVERTLNNSDFSEIGRVESRGPSNNFLEYQTWDLAPVEGIQYYYLRQHDLNGKVANYGPVSATYTRDLFDIITATVSSSEQGVTVAFNYNSTEPYSYKIMDVTGRVVVSKANNSAEPGANVIDIPASLSKGIYHIVLQNSSKVVSRKFFY